MRHAFPAKQPDRESAKPTDHVVENLSAKTVFGIEPGDSGHALLTEGALAVLIKAGLVKVIAEPSEEAEPETVDDILDEYVHHIVSDEAHSDDNQEGE